MFVCNLIFYYYMACTQGCWCGRASKGKPGAGKSSSRELPRPSFTLEGHLYSFCFSTAVQEKRCPSRQTLRLERLRTKVEPLLTELNLCRLIKEKPLVTLRGP